MASSRVRAAIALVRRSVRNENAYLVPLRLFIGIGWFRAGLEKVLDPKWNDGAALAAFLHKKVDAGDVVFPTYQLLIEQVFLPNVGLLSVILIVGQLLAGTAILLGAFTNLGLLGGLFMNINFILAGQVNPSAFYVVIESVLFIANVGAVMGFDEVIANRVRYPWLVAHPHWDEDYVAMEKRSFLILALLSGLVALVASVHVRDWGPTSVDDPAMILLVLSSLGGLSTLIVYFRFRDRPSLASMSGPTP
jgi:thiosulfate dehydrogenase [quinone] large subunit